MALSTEFKNLTEVLARDFNEGRGSRQTLGAQGAAFGWTSGMPLTVANFFTTSQADALSVPVATATLSATPPTIVAPGAPKPAAVDVLTGSIALKKFAGIATINLEDSLGNNGMSAAVASVLGAGCLLAFEADAIATIDAGAGGTASGATWVAGILAAQATVLAAGGSPGVVIVSAADYAALITELGASAGYTTSSASPVGEFFGSALHISAKAVAGKAWVADVNSILCVENKESPLITLDPFSGAGSNIVRIVADVIAATHVVNGDYVVEVTKTP